MLTRAQMDCYNAIKDYTERNGGVSPSYDEIASMMGLNSKSGISRLIKGLEERGALERIPHRARAYRLLDLNAPRRT